MLVWREILSDRITLCQVSTISSKLGISFMTHGLCKHNAENHTYYKIGVPSLPPRHPPVRGIKSLALVGELPPPCSRRATHRCEGPPLVRGGPSCKVGRGQFPHSIKLTSSPPLQPHVNTVVTAMQCMGGGWGEVQSRGFLETDQSQD